MGIFQPLQSAAPPLFQRGVQAIYRVLFKPYASTTVERRKERTLTIILFVLIVCIVLIEIFWITARSRGLFLYYTNNGLLRIIFNALALCIIGLFIGVRKGFYQPVSYIFLSLFFLCTVYASLIWGVSITVGLLSYTTIALLSWLIIGRRFALYVSGLIVAVVFSLANRTDTLETIPAWQQGVLRANDTLEDVVMFVLLIFLSWISNRELSKSFARTRSYEKELKLERDNLERTVTERTRALMQVEHERVAQLAHFAEFGKISAGLFHDLMNPLTAVSIAVGKLNTQGVQTALTQEAKAAVERAIIATQNMEHFMATVRKNIKTQEFQELFSINTEVYDVLEMIRFKAKRLNIKCCFKAKQEVLLYGNALKFNQIIANIVSNAVDSYVDSVAPKNRRTVYINLKKRKSIIILSVADHGSGIPVDVQDTVFDPFITTKTNGLGLGLSTTKDIIEHDFSGTIGFVSTQDDGTIFTIEIPSRLHE